jgi:hypothetical protein
LLLPENEQRILSYRVGIPLGTQPTMDCRFVKDFLTLWCRLLFGTFFGVGL